jgi:hypothetical protein
MVAAEVDANKTYPSSRKSHLYVESRTVSARLLKKTRYPSFDVLKLGKLRSVAQKSGIEHHRSGPN